MSRGGHARSFRSLALAGSALSVLGLTPAAAAAAAQGPAGQVATPQTLAAKVAAAAEGETILLASGDYGALQIRKRRFSDAGLVVEPQPGAKAVFTSIDIGDAQGITIRDVEIDVQKQGGFGVTVGQSSRISLSGLKIHAPADLEPSAMLLRNSTDVTVSDCDMRDLGTGINFIDSDHVKVLRNTFSDIQVDAIRGASSHVEVIGNHASNFHPKTGDHPDFIQFWATKEGGPSTGNQIRDNVYERGAGGAVQGIFLEDSNDVEISGNALLGTMYNGISLARVHQAVIENNFVQGYPDMGARIITRGGSSGVTIRNNLSQSIIDYTDRGMPNTDYHEERNRSIGAAKVGDEGALQAWLAKKNAP